LDNEARVQLGDCQLSAQSSVHPEVISALRGHLILTNAFGRMAGLFSRFL
jgi:hypothetical protein